MVLLTLIDGEAREQGCLGVGERRQYYDCKFLYVFDDAGRPRKYYAVVPIIIHLGIHQDVIHYQDHKSEHQQLTRFLDMERD